MQNATRRLVVGLQAVCVLWWASCFGAAPSSCDVCHKDPKFFVEDRELFNYYQEWLQSPHKQAGLDCSDCHGGNPQVATKEAAHRGVLSVTNPQSRIYFRNQVATCGRCHEREARHFKESFHYKALERQDRDMVRAPTCYTCHRVMDQMPNYENLVSQTCLVCHYENNDQELPLVANKTQDTLHHLNMAKGYLGWTQLYYQGKNWPKGSKEEVAHLLSQYRDIIAAGHSFHLGEAGRASRELAAKLKLLFMKEEAQSSVDEGQSLN